MREVKLDVRGKIVLSCFYEAIKNVVLVPALDGFIIISIIKLCFSLCRAVSRSFNQHESKQREPRAPGLGK